MTSFIKVSSSFWENALAVQKQSNRQVWDMYTIFGL